MRQRVDIVRPTETPTGKGGYVTAFPPVALSVAAEVIGLTGGEAVVEKVLQGLSLYRITLRWRADIKPKDQLRYGEQDLNITSAVDPDGRREALVILATTEGALATVGVP